MGLDITAYRKLTKLNATVDEDGYGVDSETGKKIEGDYFVPNFNHEFDRHEGLEHGVYSFEEDFAFRAGSYGGYSRFRDDLAKLAGYQEHPTADHDRHAESAWEAGEGPFWEMIYFSDCEGTIGPKVSAKIAQDFSNHQIKADAHEDEYFRERYSNWRKAFEMAAEGGAVDFH